MQFNAIGKSYLRGNSTCEATHLAARLRILDTTHPFTMYILVSLCFVSRSRSTFPEKDYVPSKHLHYGTPNYPPLSSSPYPTNSYAMHVFAPRMCVATAMDGFVSLMVANLMSWTGSVVGLGASLVWPNLSSWRIVCQSGHRSVPS